MRFLLLSFLTLCSTALHAQGRFIQLDSSQIWVKTIGLEQRKAGQPVIVCESGHGTPLGNWERIEAGVSALAPMVMYDRPGVGKSEPDDRPGTLKGVSDRLVDMLQKLEVPPPYVLVGHSLGGVLVRGFAIYYPEMLAGLVIIDPGDFTENHENRREYWKVFDWDEARIDSAVQWEIQFRTARSSKAPLAIQKEGNILGQLRETEFAEINAHPLPNIPVHMLAGGRLDGPETAPFHNFNRRALFEEKMRHRSLRWMAVVQSVDKGMFFYSGDAGHFIQWDDPELVVASIKLVLADWELLQEQKE